MKNKKWIAAFLLLLFSVQACSVSCSKKETSTTATTVAADTTLAPVAEETGEFDDRLNVDDGIGEYDFKGADFNIVLSTEQMEEPYFVEEETGEVIDDAVYARTQTIEERFKVKLNHHDTGGNWSEVADALRKSVMAGDNAYDLGIAHTFVGLTGLMGSGYLYDWNQLPIVDMEKPWWNHSVKDQLTIDGALYTASSDYVYQRPMVIYFNKDMIKNYDLENPYELVKSGKWTWDKLGEMADAVSKDLNGDGAYDDKDQYGYSHTLGWQTITVIHSQGMNLATLDSDGYPRYDNFNTDKMATIFQKYYDLLYTGNRTLLVPYDSEQGAKNGYTPLFGAGQILFLHSNTELLQDFRDLKLDFGMLPLPKYDEAQEGYYSMADTQVLVVPHDVKDPTMVGVISEALAVESYKTVVPAVYEVTFASKYLRDDESYDMFNIIRNGLVYEFSWTYGEGNSMTYALPNLMMEKNINLASYYAKNIKGAERQLVKTVDSIRELKE